jgi:hypothetical protein
VLNLLNLSWLLQNRLISSLQRSFQTTILFLLVDILKYFFLNPIRAHPGDVLFPVSSIFLYKLYLWNLWLSHNFFSSFYSPHQCHKSTKINTIHKWYKFLVLTSSTCDRLSFGNRWLLTGTRYLRTRRCL